MHSNIAKTQAEYVHNCWPRAEEGFETWHKASEHATDLLTVRDAMEATDEAVARKVMEAEVDWNA